MVLTIKLEAAQILPDTEQVRTRYYPDPVLIR